MASKPAKKSPAKRVQRASAPNKDWTLQVLVPGSAVADENVEAGLRSEFAWQKRSRLDIWVGGAREHGELSK